MFTENLKMQIESTPRNSTVLCCYCKDTIISGSPKEWTCKNCNSLMHLDCLGENSNKCGQCRAYSSPTNRTKPKADNTAAIDAEVDRQRRQRYRSFRREPENRYGMRGPAPQRRQPSRVEKAIDWIKDRNRSKWALIFLSVILIGGGGWKYKVAYENSATYINITIADKQTHVYHDDDGDVSSTSYTVYTHAGEEFYVKGEGWGRARNLYNRLRVNQQYTALVAGLGYFNRDLIAATPKPKPKPRLAPQLPEEE